jgi:hypothetical protein
MDKKIAFEVIRDIYWDDWGHFRRVFSKGDVCVGTLHSDGDVTAESPYYEGISDYVDINSIVIKEGKYRVHTEWDCSEEFDSIEEAEKKFEYYKGELMADGVDEDSYVEIVISDDDFDDYEVIKKVKAVVDSERMKISNPRDEGFDWDYWAKWQEV